MGIHISKRAYNQLELFVNSFPGNCYGMSAYYDRFLTLGDTATCLIYMAMAGAYGTEAVTEAYYNEQVKSILDKYSTAEIAVAGIFASKYLDRKGMTELGILSSGSYLMKICTKTKSLCM